METPQTAVKPFMGSNDNVDAKLLVPNLVNSYEIFIHDKGSLVVYGSPVSPTAVSEEVIDLSIPHTLVQIDTVVGGLTSGKDIVNVFVEEDSHAKVDADVNIQVGCDYEMSFDGAASISTGTSHVFDMGPVTIKNKK
ncbi:hypothetical protein ACOSQ3_007368 [Xanthoceras sorbifolium]